MNKGNRHQGALKFVLRRNIFNRMNVGYVRDVLFPFVSTLFLTTLLCALGGWTPSVAQALLTSSWIWSMESISTWRRVRAFITLLTLASLQVGRGCITPPKARAPVWHPSPVTATVKATVTFSHGLRRPFPFRSRMLRFLAFASPEVCHPLLVLLGFYVLFCLEFFVCLFYFVFQSSPQFHK